MAKREAQEQLTKTQVDPTCSTQPQKTPQCPTVADVVENSPKDKVSVKDPKSQTTQAAPLFTSLFPSLSNPASIPSGTGLFTVPAGGLFGGPSLFNPKETKDAPAAPAPFSLFGSSFPQGSSLFSQSTLGPLSFGAKAQISNPFANYKPPAGQEKDGSGSEDEEGGEVEKKCPSPETFKPNPDKSLKSQSQPLVPSPYTKVISMNIAKFKVEKNSKGSGIISIEKGEVVNGQSVAMLVFRNAFGAVMFQGQLMKNVSKFIKHISPKAYKIQRIIAVIAKKDNNTTGITKCRITFAAEPDCKQFQASFYEVVGALPEIIKTPTKPETKKEEKKVEEKKANDSRTETKK